MNKVYFYTLAMGLKKYMYQTAGSIKNENGNNNNNNNKLSKYRNAFIYLHFTHFGVIGG